MMRRAWRFLAACSGLWILVFASWAAADQSAAVALKAGSTLVIGGSTVQIKDVAVSDKIPGASEAPKAGRTFLTVQIAVTKAGGDNDRPSTLGFEVLLKDKTRVTAPGFVKDIVYNGQVSKAVGKDGATAYLGAADSVVLWFDVPAGTRVDGAKLGYQPPAPRDPNTR
jgi:hypothetical protein